MKEQFRCRQCGKETPKVLVKEEVGINYGCYYCCSRDLEMIEKSKSKKPENVKC